MQPQSITTRFLEFVQEILTNHDESNQNLMHYLDIFSSFSSESFYVINTQKRQFSYVSPNAFFLCGHTTEEAMELGYDFYKKIVHPDDLSLWFKIHQCFLQYLDDLDEKRDEAGYFSCTFRLQQKMSFLSKPLPITVYKKMKPVWINDRLRYMICSMEVSVINQSGYPRMYATDGQSYEAYNMKTERWKKTIITPLTEREKAILLLAKQGKKIKEIADMFNLSPYTIRNQTSALLLKLNVRSMMEAVTFAFNHRMIYASETNKQTNKQTNKNNSAKKGK